MKLWLDIETRSKVPIRQGTAKYARQANVIILSWALDDGEIHVEDMTRRAEPSDEFYDALQMADEIWAHNSEFDRTVLENMPFWPSSIPLTKWRCTAALARMNGLPGGLDKLSKIFHLGIDDAKDDEGKELIKLFCIPNKFGSFREPDDYPESWAKFMMYAGQDIQAMRTVYKRLPKWNATDRLWAMWHLDQIMNGRGVQFDMQLAINAVTLTKRAKKDLAAQLRVVTHEEFTPTQNARLLAYLNANGCPIPDLKADTIDRALGGTNFIPDEVKEVLRIRQQAAKSSTSKYQRVLDCNVAGRVYNMVVCFGAARTGRMAGRLIQPHNFPRPKHKPWQIEAAIRRFHNMDYDGLELIEGGVMPLAASCLRGLLIAKDKHKLVVADLANIEGRIMAWIAGEEWKLEAFKAYDAKRGPDLYKVAYARPFQIDPNDIADENDMRRQIGKVMELALQYYGGVGAFCNMAETYGLKLDELAAAAWDTLPPHIIQFSQKAWHKAVKAKKTYDLPEKQWIVCRALVQMWRDAHPGVTGFWAELDSAVAMAIKNPGKRYKVGEWINVDKKGAWLRIQLPSGRYLGYPAARLDLETGRIKDFLGVNPFTKQWGRISTYSGKLTENIVQAIAADILMDGLLAANKMGFTPILSVHDEIICEPTAAWKFEDKDLSRIMCESSPWTGGRLPLAAKGFTGPRYRK